MGSQDFLPQWLWRWPLFLMLLMPLMFLARTTEALHGSDVRCRGREGENVEVPGITTTNPCYTCRCVRGIVECEDARRRCPSLAGCYVLAERQPGECCQRCAGCPLLLNKTHVAESGDNWLDADDPCLANTCHSGVVTRQKVECDAAATTATCAAKPSPPGPGECCPSCATCQLAGGRWLHEGETVHGGGGGGGGSGDPCSECQCRGGRLTCTRRVCPVLACPANLQSTPAGECCPQCSRRRSPFYLSPEKDNNKDSNKCLFRNRLLVSGEEMYTDTCTTCTCSPSSGTSAAAVLCMRANCAAAAAHTPSCEHEGTARPHGAQWASSDCHSCRCERGRVECSRTACPDCPPGTTALAVAPGECCPACRRLPPPPPPPVAPVTPAAIPSLGGKEGVCTVFGDPHYKTFDGRVFNFQGSCKYLLTRDCGNANVNSSFSIRITNDARDTVAFSWLRTVTVRLADTKVSLLQKMRVKVNQ